MSLLGGSQDPLRLQRFCGRAADSREAGAGDGGPAVRDQSWRLFWFNMCIKDRLCDRLYTLYIYFLYNSNLYTYDIWYPMILYIVFWSMGIPHAYLLDTCQGRLHVGRCVWRVSLSQKEFGCNKSRGWQLVPAANNWLACTHLQTACKYM